MEYLSRQQVRQEVEVDFGDGLQSITDGAGTAAQIIDSTRNEQADYWKGSDLLILDGAQAFLDRRVSSSTNLGVLNTAAFPLAPGTGINYELFDRYTLGQYNNSINEAVRRAWGKHFVPWYWDALVPADQTYDYALPYRYDRGQLACIDGSTGWVQIALTEANDFWNGGRIVPITGNNKGLWRNIADWTLSTQRIVPDIPWPSTNATGDEFHIIRFAPDRILGVEWYTTGNVLSTVVPARDLTIVNRMYPYLRVNNVSVPSAGSTVRVYGLRRPELPTHDLHPVEVPQGYAINLTRWQLLRSRSRRPEFSLDNIEILKREAWDKAEIDLLRERLRAPAESLRVQ